MRVCLLNDSFPPVIDGVANVVMNYGRIMQEDLGAEVLVGTPRYPNADYSGYPYRVIDYPSVNTTKLVSGYRTGNPFSATHFNEMAAFGPQIIHSHCPASSMLLARILQNETGAPLVFTYHTKFDVDIARAVGDGSLKKNVVKAMVSNISASDEVWVVSRGAGENLRSLGYEGDYRVVSNGVDFVKGRADDAKVREVTGKYDLPENVPVFLFVGRIMEYKGLPIILDAMKELRDAGMDFRCVFVGGGADASKMQEMAKEYALTLEIVKEDGSVESEAGSGCGKVLFTGPIHDREALRAWNTRADLFLFPSVYDTNGIVVREAAACGLASVLIEGSCAAEGITDGRNGYTIAENGAAMAALLQKVCKDMDAVHEVGQHAMDEIYISWEDSTKAAYERYGEICEMWQSGELKRRRKHVSDITLEAATGVSEVTSALYHLPENLYNGAKEDLGMLKENIAVSNEGMMENIADVSEYIRGEIEEFWESLPPGVRIFFANIKEGARNLRQNTKEGARDLGTSMKEGTREMGNDAVELMKEFGTAAKDGIHEAKDGLKVVGNNVKEGMKEFGNDAAVLAKEFGSTFKELGNSIKDGSTEAANSAKEGLAGLSASARDGLKELGNAVRDEFGGKGSKAGEEKKWNAPRTGEGWKEISQEEDGQYESSKKNEDS